MSQPDKKKSSRDSKPAITRPSTLSSRDKTPVATKKNAPKTEPPLRSKDKALKPVAKAEHSDEDVEKPAAKISIKNSKIKQALDESPEALARKEQDIKMTQNLRVLSETVIEVLRSSESRPKSKRAGGKIIENNDITWSLSYKKILDLSTFKLYTQHKIVCDLYDKFREDILRSLRDEDKKPSTGSRPRPYMDWMCGKTIEIFFGAGIEELKKKNLRLRISGAYDEAVEIRVKVDSKNYNNPNQRDKARGEFNYTYGEILHYQFLVVIIDALGKEHKDHSVLNDIANEFKSRTYLRDTSDDSSASSSEEGGGMGDMVANITGQKMKKGEAEHIISTFTKDGNIVKTMGTLFKDIKNLKTDNPNEDPSKGIENIMHSMAPTFAAFAAGLGKTMDSVKNMGGGGSDSSSSGDSDEESSSESASSD